MSNKVAETTESRVGDGNKNWKPSDSRIPENLILKLDISLQKKLMKAARTDCSEEVLVSAERLLLRAFQRFGQNEFLS